MTAGRIVTALAVSGALVATPAVASRSLDRQTCKRVHDAVWAGHTIEQLTAEFNTDAAHIMKCVQSRGGKKPKAKKSQSAASAHGSKQK